MALYLIGDIQSCYTPFKQLLQKIDFSPSRDELILLGDMINRGTETLETVEAILQLDGAVKCLLGNHDIHFLSVAYGLRAPRPHDTLNPLLQSAKKDFYVSWFRQQHLALDMQGWLMVHAGVLPQWSKENTLAYAKEIEDIIRSPDIKAFLQDIFGDQPNHWTDDLQGMDRLRIIVNTLTRIRFCYADGRLDMNYKKGLLGAPKELVPWFKLPHRLTANIPIAFGHWSMLEEIQPAPNLLALDTGCLWGGKLSAAQIHNGKVVQITQVACEKGISPI